MDSLLVMGFIEWKTTLAVRVSFSESREDLDVSFLSSGKSVSRV